MDPYNKETSNKHDLVLSLIDTPTVLQFGELKSKYITL